MSLVLVGLVMLWVVVAIACWLGYLVVRQNGRILLRLEALERSLARPEPLGTPANGHARPAGPVGLPLGSAAPDFELPDLSGARRRLADWRGSRVLVLFFDPHCSFCGQLAAELPAWRRDPLPLIVSTGDHEETRRLIERHKIPFPVLMQTQREVADAYRAGGTPMGYLVDARGLVASALAAGGPALRALNAGGVKTTGLQLRPLSESRILRTGLAAGTPAPDFRLPRLDGGELSLAAYRGERVLLVFSDPECAPCDELAPRLEALHRRRDAPRVVMVSRGSPDAVRRKAAEHRLTFPIALQQQWEVSRLYGMFATPIGYLIDADGVIVADVATGAEPILSLAIRTRPAEASAPRRA